MTPEILLVALCILAVTTCGWYARSDSQRTSAAHRNYLLAICICFTGATLLTFLVASTGGLGGALSLMILVATISITIPGGLTLFFMLRPSRRWLPLLFAVISPFVLWGSMVAGDIFAPEKQTINQADTIIRALEAYRAATGSYPETLNVLLTGDLQVLPEVTGPFDWFYTSSGDAYRLGYVPTVDRWTYTAYIYASERATWEFDIHPLNEGPFVVPATQFPG